MLSSLYWLSFGKRQRLLHLSLWLLGMAFSCCICVSWGLSGKTQSCPGLREIGECLQFIDVKLRLTIQLPRRMGLHKQPKNLAELGNLHELANWTELANLHVTILRQTTGLFSTAFTPLKTSNANKSVVLVRRIGYERSTAMKDFERRDAYSACPLHCVAVWCSM